MKKTALISALIAVLWVSNYASETEQERGITKSFKVSKGGILEVSVGGGDIRISGWERDEVQVKAVGIDEEDTDEFQAEQHGGTVRVKYNSSWGLGSDVKLDISVPSEFDLDLTNSGGDIRIEGPLEGKLEGITSCGNIRLGDLGGRINMKTSAGDIHTGDIKGDLFLSTSGGDISVGTVSGESEITTSGGEIRTKDVGKKLRARTAGGDVVIGSVGGSADVSTAGGNILLGTVKGSASVATAGGDVRLEGASGTVSAKTSGGNLDLRNVSGSVRGSTAGGDITAVLNPGSSEKSKLATAAGDIKLYLPAASKATVEARIHIQGSWRQREDYDIKSDFPIEKREEDRENRDIRATIQVNGGGPAITLETTMGNIYVRRGEPSR